MEQKLKNSIRRRRLLPSDSMRFISSYPVDKSVLGIGDAVFPRQSHHMGAIIARLQEKPQDDKMRAFFEGMLSIDKIEFPQQRRLKTPADDRNALIGDLRRVGDDMRTAIIRYKIERIKKDERRER